jgi:hypothetical protein
MAVVINDFEVVQPAAAAEPAPAKAADKKKDKPKADPEEIVRVLRRHAERAARVRAH